MARRTDNAETGGDQARLPSGLVLKPPVSLDELKTDTEYDSARGGGICGPDSHAAQGALSARRSLMDMTGLGRRLAVIAGVLIAISLVILVLFGAMALLSFKGVPSNIVDFRPVAFFAKTDTKFFYSVGDELKYSDQIDVHSPTLMRGKISNFLVSPNNEKVAVVANGQLVIVGTDSILRQVATVDSIYKEPKPLGRQFFRDDNFQWTKDSKVLNLIRDEYYASRGSQLYSSKGELWKYDVETGDLRLVLKPFRAYTYFIGIKSGIYFSTPTPTGDLQLKYFDGRGVTDVDQPNANEIGLQNRVRGFVEVPFYSFSIQDYEHAARTEMSVTLSVDEGNRQESLVIRGRPYLAITLGKGFKGDYYCSEMLRSVFLPGDRYFLFNARYCGNYNGQLLIDALSGAYQRLPLDSVVYLTLNTETFPHYRITGAGIIAQ